MESPISIQPSTSSVPVTPSVISNSNNGALCLSTIPKGATPTSPAPASPQTTYLPEQTSTSSRLSLSQAISAPEMPMRKLQTSKTWQVSMSTTNSPRQPSPRTFAPQHSRHNSTPPLPISLPPPAASPTEPLPQQTKQSLMRRVSQKAADKLLRRSSSMSKAKTTANERSGPVVARHRSGSTNATGPNVPRLGIQNHDEDDEEEAIVIGTETSQTGGTNGQRDGIEGAALRRHNSATPDDTVGIVVPGDLQNGTAMTRVTRKKKVQRTFILNANRAVVSWDPEKPTSTFCIDDMKDVRTGANARNYREELQVSQDSESRWITITYMDPENGKLKFLHVIAPTDHMFNLWISTIESIHRYRTEMMAGLAMQGEKFVDAHWRSYMANSKQSSSTAAATERLTFDDVEKMCKQIHINCSRRYLHETFRRADEDSSGYLNFQEFRRFVKLLKEREEIVGIWEAAVSNPAVGMNRDEFRAFLRDIQKTDVEADEAHVNKVFRKFCRQSSKLERIEGVHKPQVDDLESMTLTQEVFADFLLSQSYNPPLRTPPGELKHDRPLNEYFISSSHNTYLLGRQINGESSVEGYIRALQRGCRCVEIDCWDGEDGRPRVTHGHTATTEVLFSDCVSAIGEYAFRESPYPVILSLEVHCCHEQQIKMAEILKSVLGEALVTEPFMTNSFILPTPDELKNKILVKVKPSSAKDEALLKNDVNAIERKLGSSGAAKNSSVGGAFVKGQSSSSAVSTTSESEHDSGGGGKMKKRPATKIAPELGVLGVYCRGQKFRNFALPESKSFNHIFSFQENSFLKFCKEPEKKTQMEKHNTRYLMRVYPSGFRVNSSNFDPLAFWRRGVQMVALNWQTYDHGVQLNDAMFAAPHDNTGYVLKPKCLRGPRTSFDPPADAAAARLKKDRNEVSFSIDVISAQQLPRPKDTKPDERINPFVEVEVFTADDKSKGTSTGEGGTDMSDSKGMSGLGAPQKRRTKAVKDDGFHPLFREKMKFSLVTKFEELVFVRFSVFNQENSGDDKTLMARYTAKLSSLQHGYRHLPLYDTQGEQFLFSTLFVKITVNPSVRVPTSGLPDRDALRAAASSTMDSLKSTAKSVLSRGKSLRGRVNKKDEGDNLGRGNAGGAGTTAAAATNISRHHAR